MFWLGIQDPIYIKHLNGLHPPTYHLPKDQAKSQDPRYKVFSIYVQSNHKYSWYLHIKRDSFYNNIICTSSLKLYI